MITVENIIKTYDGLKALDGVSAHFERGKITVILGGSGSGKTTLLRQITGLEKPTSGRILFGDSDITRIKKKELFELRKRMGMLFQGGALFNSISVYENIAFPLREHAKLAESTIRTMVKMKLELVGLRGMEGLMPSQLSGGMMKRVALARSLIMDPQVVFYDEPTSGLDPISAGVIDKLIKDLNATLGVTSVVVSHDIVSAFNIAHKIIILYFGKKIAEGTVEDIKSTEDERVIQFIEGRPEGPIPFSRSDKDFFEDILIS